MTISTFVSRKDVSINFLGTILLLLGCISVQAGSESVWESALASDGYIDKPAVLRERLALDGIPISDTRAGVVMDWSSVHMQEHVEGADWTLVSESAYPVADGEAMRSWTWRNGEASLAVEVFVSSAGPVVARDRLVTLATENTRSDVPFVRGPADLGDVSTVFPTLSGYQSLIWAYGNVCVSITAVDAKQFDALRLARALQGDLAHHRVADLDRNLPRIVNVSLSRKRVVIDEPLTIEMAIEQAVGSKGEWLFGIDGRDNALRIESGIGFETIVRSEKPGVRNLTMLVADSGTLLSAWADVTFDVVEPGREVAQ